MRHFLMMAVAIGLGTLTAAAAMAAPDTGPGVSPQAQLQRIAAVVNDDIITSADLNGRIMLALVASGLQDTPENRQRLAPQVLRGLVDERLQMQEANKEKIEVPDSEIESQITHIADQNHQTTAQMERFLESHGVPIATLRNQLHAALSWQRLSQRKLRPDIEIGDDQIDAVLERIKSNAGKPEYLVAEIFLAVDNPTQDEGVRKAADRLVEQIGKGANFAAVAQQFSQSAGASNGGDLGWVLPDQLPPDLDKVLRGLEPGSLSLPVRTPSGYYILYLRERRAVMAADPGDAKLELRQITMPLPENATPEDRVALRHQAESVRAGLKGCDSMDARIKELNLKGGSMGTVKLRDLPPAVAKVMAGLPDGEPSPLLGSETGIFIVMACHREQPGSAAPSRESIADSLAMQQFDMLQRRLLRDLRSAAFVDVRA